MQKILKALTPNPNKIWFGVSREINADFFSRAIQSFQNTDYSHSLAIYYSIDINDFIITNSHGVGVQLDLLADFYSDAEVTILFECDIDAKQRENVLRRAIELDGVKYGASQIFAIGWAKIFKSRESIIENNDKQMTCSEYLDQLTESVGLPTAEKLLRKSRELILPKDNVETWIRLANMPNYKTRFRKVL